MGEQFEEAKKLIEFINNSPDPYHAVHTVSQILGTHGFKQLFENKEWKLEPKGRYFFTRNHSTIIAFAVGGKYVAGQGFNIVGAHTDSPHLKLKPVSKKSSQGCLQVGVQVYGGGLWHTWFDRDLKVSGRVITQGKEDGKLQHRLVHVKRPILKIPNLAIHLTSTDERNGFVFNKETHLGYPIIATETYAPTKKSEKKVSDAEKSHVEVLVKLIAQELNVKKKEIKDLDISLSDVQSSCLGGAHNEFVFSPRLDNLCMCFCAVQSLVQSLDTLEHEGRIRMIALFDHEEIGSQSAYGADSSIVPDALRRIVSVLSPNISVDTTSRAFANSLLLSADMAHAVHPNYAERHDSNHKPLLHHGPVIKYNANQRYASTTTTAVLFKEVCKKVNVPVQEFVVKNDSPCGSTIGPILSSHLGVRTLDLGLPQFSMHSIRETCGAKDVEYGVTALKSFFNNFSALDEEAGQGSDYL